MSNFAEKSKVFVRRNAPTILTCLGGAGVVATSILAVKATPKAITLLEEATKEKGEELTKLEVIKTAGPAYIPSIVMGASTIACIFGANILNQRRQAALMSAYALLDRSYKDYRRKVADLYGGEADSKVKEEIAKDKYEKEEITVEDKMEYLNTYISKHKKFSFRDLLTKQKSKTQLVVTFLAILEMMKMGKIWVEQENTFDDIVITSKVMDEV